MSGGISAATLATAAATAVGTIAVTQALKPKTPGVNIPTPEKPPQASKGPDRGAINAANVAAAAPGGALSGNSGTFLTGPLGVDPGSLNLGKNKLLGQ